jgi:spectinomycin phosphotransferase
MLERPGLADATLIEALRSGYGLTVDELAFVPLGNDSAAWTYRARSEDGGDWFVKVRRSVRPAALLVPRFLADHGFEEVVAARSTRDGRP